MYKLQMQGESNQNISALILWGNTSVRILSPNLFLHATKTCWAQSATEQIFKQNEIRFQVLDALFFPGPWVFFYYVFGIHFCFLGHQMAELKEQILKCFIRNKKQQEDFLFLCYFQKSTMLIRDCVSLGEQPI